MNHAGAGSMNAFAMPPIRKRTPIAIANFILCVAAINAAPETDLSMIIEDTGESNDGGPGLEPEMMNEEVELESSSSDQQHE